MATVELTSARIEASNALEPPLASDAVGSPPRIDDGGAAVAKQADDLGAIRDSVNDAAAVSGGLWISYLSAMVYFAIATASVTHLDLFLERPLKLPILSVDLPLLAYFVIAPLLFLIVHAYTLMHFVMLASKAVRFHEALYESCLSTPDATRRRTIRDNLLRQLPSNIFVQFLAGPPETRDGIFGRALRWIALITLVIAPVFLLLLIQVQFLPYQGALVTWWHRLALLIDLWLLWWLWPKILRGQDTERARRADGVSVICLGFSLLAVVFSFWVATSEDERYDRAFPVSMLLPDIGDISDDEKLPDDVKLADDEDCAAAKPSAGFFSQWKVYEIHDYLFRSPIGCISRRRVFPFSSTLVLTGVDVQQALSFSGAEKPSAGEYVFRARGRNLDGAVFDFATLSKFDFEGAHLDRASFLEARISDSTFHQAYLNGARFIRARAQGTSFDGKELDHTSFHGSDLRGADFHDTRLSEVDLSSVNLMGANFKDACLLHTRLSASDIFGAEFSNAVLRDADFANTNIFASFFTGAQVDGANFRGAKVESSDFEQVSLHAAVGPALLLDHLRYHPANAKSALCSDARSAETSAPSQASTATEFQAELAAAPRDDNLFSGDEAPKLFERLCAENSSSIYFLRNLVFVRLTGPDLPAIISYMLSADSPVAGELTGDERTDLVTQLMTMPKQYLDESGAQTKKPNGC